eukprot:scaffold519_cov102-Isochrysis_galbana.AAC.7
MMHRHPRSSCAASHSVLPSSSSAWPAAASAAAAAPGSGNSRSSSYSIHSGNRPSMYVCGKGVWAA